MLPISQVADLVNSDWWSLSTAVVLCTGGLLMLLVAARSKHKRLIFGAVIASILLAVTSLFLPRPFQSLLVICLILWGVAGILWSIVFGFLALTRKIETNVSETFAGRSKGE
jgi:peptidoglycan/LPS O-acetylase OafA/YrhL